jgi:hypothetical protein
MASIVRAKSISAADRVGVPVRIAEPEPFRDRDDDGRPFLRDAFQPVLTIRGCVEAREVPTFIREALHEIRVYIEDQAIEVRGEPFSVIHSTSPAGVDVEAGWPVSESSGSGRISPGAMPLCLVRSRRRHALSGGRGSLP